ncbi:MAG: thioredoxin family protein [Pirellulaceae bacterium]
MTKVQILGMGCASCQTLFQYAQQAVQEEQLDCQVEKVTDIMQIFEFQPMALPALAINGEVVSAGRVPAMAEIRRFLAAAESAP